MSSLRAVLPSGSVVSVERVKPIAEKIISFNGRKRRLVEVADNMKKESNGVCISLSMDSPMIGMSSDVIIGNLGKEKVCEVVRQCNEKGYYDFSQLEYQKVESLDTLKLGAEHLPYTSENNMMLNVGLSNFPCNMGGQIFGSSIFGGCDEFNGEGFEGDDEGSEGDTEGEDC